MKYKNTGDNSAAVMVGTVVGCLCFIGVAAALAVGAAIYIVRRRKAYVKVPLIVDEYVLVLPYVNQSKRFFLRAEILKLFNILVHNLRYVNANALGRKRI